MNSLFLASVATVMLSQVNAGQYGWLADYERARTQARATGKPIMLVFRCVP